jgi:hypothetical protein
MAEVERDWFRRVMAQLTRMLRVNLHELVVGGSRRPCAAGAVR